MDMGKKIRILILIAVFVGGLGIAVTEIGRAIQQQKVPTAGDTSTAQGAEQTKVVAEYPGPMTGCRFWIFIVNEESTPLVIKMDTYTGECWHRDRFTKDTWRKGPG